MWLFISTSFLKCFAVGFRFLLFVCVVISNTWASNFFHCSNIVTSVTKNFNNLKRNIFISYKFKQHSFTNPFFKASKCIELGHGYL